jgi:hypothetical protein
VILQVWIIKQRKINFQVRDYFICKRKVLNNNVALLHCSFALMPGGYESSCLLYGD